MEETEAPGKGKHFGHAGHTQEKYPSAHRAAPGGDIREKGTCVLPKP